MFEAWGFLRGLTFRMDEAQCLRFAGIYIRVHRLIYISIGF